MLKKPERPRTNSGGRRILLRVRRRRDNFHAYECAYDLARAEDGLCGQYSKYLWKSLYRPSKRLL
eukprot:23313-Eustigmatos_ZCMA.PRE.1